MKTLIHPDEAQALIAPFSRALPIETLPLDEALGRVLAQDMLAQVDSPPFDKSAMDGFALAGDQPETGYPVLATIAAGDRAGASGGPALQPGQAVRIMTGAPLPAGADRVQRFEWSELRGDRVFCTRAESSRNIIFRAENLRAGDPLLSQRRLEAADIGILASSGWAAVPVVRRPRVAIVSTGNELRVAGQPLESGQIWDSNGPQLMAQATAAGGLARFYGIVADQPDELLVTLGRALDENDVLVVSGGVSLGDFDHIPAALVAAGAEPVFHQLHMRPGKPTWFGWRPFGVPAGRGCAAFGLPGNPVSTFVNFEVLVRPLIAGLGGLPTRPQAPAARMAAEFRRRNSAVVEYTPVRVVDGLVHPLVYHGSSMLNILCEANALLRLEIGQEFIKEGEKAHVRLIRT